MIAALETGLVESTLRNLPGGDGSSVGWRQETASSYPNVNRRDVAGGARRFFEEAKGGNRRGTAGKLAQSVQRSAFPGRYDQVKGQAKDLQQWLKKEYKRGKGGGGKPGGKGAYTTRKPDKVTPGIDRSEDRQQLKLSYLENRHDPDALLGLASGLKEAQDTPEVRIPGKVVHHAAVEASTDLSSGDGGGRAVRFAKREVGTRESGNNAGAITKYGGGAGQAWCGFFVGHIAKQAGAKLTSRVAYVPNIVSDAQSRSNGFKGWSKKAHDAHPGDFVVLFNSGHVEMVTKVHGDGSVSTIGGNTSIPGGEGVGKKRRRPGEITGFALVNYGKRGKRRRRRRRG